MSYRHERYNRSQERDNARVIVDELLSEMTKEIPEWKRLLGENGLIENLVSQREFRNLNPTQLRKFFDEVKRVKIKLSESGGWSNEIEPDLWKLVPSIKYAYGREIVPKSFEYFVSKSVEKISEISDLKKKEIVFMNFERIFEAIVAYHKYKHPRG